MYTIGRLARRARVTVESIRFYERQGLLHAETKTASGYRLYTDDALRRVLFIKHAQRCSFSLAEIGELLQMHCGTLQRRKDAYNLLAHKRTELEATIESLTTMSAAMESVLSYGSAEPDERFDSLQSPLVTALQPAEPLA
jgi:MerR family Zn(II)-responsive transcriptional regulator of zntA